MLPDRHRARPEPRRRDLQSRDYLFAATNQFVEADLALDRAAIFGPNNPLIHANRAMMKLQVENIDDALKAAAEALRNAMTKPPANNPLAMAGYLLARLVTMIAATSGQPQNALPMYREMLAVDAKNPAAGPNACFVTSLMDVGPEEVLREVRDLWYQANRSPGRSGRTRTTRRHGSLAIQADHGWVDEVKTPGIRPLKVGYVGGDFKSHSAAMMFANVLLNRTPAVIPYFYSSLPTDPVADDLTQKFRSRPAASG